jgi:predicted membrane-bound spermidine synthase
VKTKFGVKLILSILFFNSGFAAIAFQVIWQKVLAQVVGVDSVSVAIIVIIFMSGLGFGSLYAAYFIEHFKRRLLLYYSFINIFIGFYGFFSLKLIREVNELLIPFVPSSFLSDLLINFLILFIPIFLMGMTTPVVIELSKEDLASLGRTEGFFYGINTLGSAIGALITNFVLIEWIGFSGTVSLASFLYLFISFIVFRIYQSETRNDNEIIADARRYSATLEFDVILPSFLFGFSSLALELILFRVLSNYLTMSALVYPVMISSFLILIAVGNYVGGVLVDRQFINKAKMISYIGISALVLITIPFIIPPSAFSGVGALVFTSFNGQLVSEIPKVRIGDPNPFVAFLFSLFFMIGVLPLASFFTIIARISTKNIENAGSRFAFILFWYTVGNIFGSFLTGLYFFEWFGTIGSLLVVLVVIFLSVTILLYSQRKKLDSVFVKQGFFLATILIFCLFAIPKDYYMRFRLGDYEPSKVYEGRNGVVSVVPTSRFYSIVDMFRTASASAIVRDPEPSEQYEAWRWNMSQMMALDPNFRPKRILIIGLGHGYLVYALLDYDFVEEIIIVDISDEIVLAVKENTDESYQLMFEDPRVKIIIDDGRRYAQRALVAGEKFDLIQNKVNEPWHSGSASLFTVEFFRVMHDLLTPNGYVAVRPKVGHAFDALQVFDYAIWPSGDYHMYFGRNVSYRPTDVLITDDIYPEFFATTPGHQDNNVPNDKGQKITLVLLNPGDLSGYQSNTDDHPIFEYYWLNNISKRFKDPRIDISLEQFKEYLIKASVEIH